MLVVMCYFNGYKLKYKYLRVQKL